MQKLMKDDKVGMPPVFDAAEALSIVDGDKDLFQELVALFRDSYAAELPAILPCAWRIWATAPTSIRPRRSAWRWNNNYARWTWRSQRGDRPFWRGSLGGLEPAPPMRWQDRRIGRRYSPADYRKSAAKPALCTRPPLKSSNCT